MDASFDAIRFNKDKVVLDSYASTQGFIGFCQSKVGWGDIRCIEAFVKILNSLIPNAVVISSVRIHGDLGSNASMYELSENDIRIRDRLIAKGVILNVSDDDVSDSFHFEGCVSSDTLKDFVWYQSSIGGIHYHGFVTNSDKALIIYSHDDCGLGFIACDDQNFLDVKRALESYSQQYSEILEFSIV